MIGYLFKTVKLIIIIFQASYFLGIFYYIYCDVTNDLAYVVELDNKYPEKATHNFIGEYMSHMTNMERAIASTYFSFTSLSTVGFGDLHPLNSYERALTAVVLLLGVAVFSIVMGNFIEISASFLDMN